MPRKELLKRFGKRVAMGAAAAAAATKPAATAAAAATVGTAKAAGRTANWAAANSTTKRAKGIMGGAMVTAFVVGAGAELFNSSGPWPGVAEGLTGERNFVSYTAKAGISAAYTSNNFEYNQGPLNYYQGGWVDPQALHRTRRFQAPDGSMVMGMYNKRRG